MVWKGRAYAKTEYLKQGIVEQILKYEAGY